MNPVVLIKVNGIEWRSEVCVSGGRNPRWEFQHMDLEVANMEHEMYIEVRDRDPFTSQMIGHVRTKVGFFAVPGGRAEWLELFFEGYPAGRIHFRSEFTP